MEPINYVPYEQGGSFTPVTPASRTRALQEEQQRQAQGLQTYFSLQDVNSARRAEERKANNYGENFKQLGAFSKTLVDLGVKIEKQSIEDRLTGEFVDGIINPQEIQAENAVIQQGTAQVEAGKATAEAITATTGNTTTAAIAQSKVLKGYGAGLQNERALLVSARSQMAGFYQNYLATSDDKVLINGQDTGWTVKQAAKSTDPVMVQAAMMKARSEFIKEFGLWQTTKRNFAEIVAPTLLQTEGYTSQGIISRNIQIEQDNSKKQIESNAYSEGRLLVTEPKREVILNKFHNLVYEAYNSTAGLTVEQAREVVAQEVIKGLIDARDTQGLAALGATPYDLRQGPDGKRIDQRTLGDVFAKDFLKARQQIDELIKKDLEEKQEEARQAAYRELAELPDNAPREQRIAVIRATQDRLEALGDYEGSIALGEKASQQSRLGWLKVVNLQLQ
jgi:hypothetical protein